MILLAGKNEKKGYSMLRTYFYQEYCAIINKTTVLII